MNDMNKAYQLAARAVWQRYSEQHPEYIKVLKNIAASDVAVYEGTYDHVQNVLTPLQIPFTLNPKVNKLGAAIVFANCSNHAPPKLKEEIDSLVHDGTWLVSSDWTLQNLVQQAFPNTVRRGAGSSGDLVVGVEPWRDSLWSGVVVPGTEPQWWLEGSSYPIDIMDTERVRVEAVSHDMLVKYRAPAVAVSFDWGAGHVFHVISHFYMQRSRAAKSQHEAPCSDFLRKGMKLSEDGVKRVMKECKVKPEQINFGTLQTAATSAELIAQLCIRASLARATR